MIKPVKFYIDVDGVILNYDVGFCEMIRKKYPDFYDPGLPSFAMIRNMCLQNIIPDAQKIYDYFMSSQYFAELPLMVELKDILKMYRLGEVTFVTNIPYHSIKERKCNLKNHGIPETKIISAGIETFGEKDYPLKSQSIRQLSETWHTSFFLDDMTENYDDIHTNLPHIHCYLMRGTENANLVLDDYRVADNFSGFIDGVQKVIQADKN